MKGTLLFFSENNSTVVTKMYSALKKDDFVNMKIFVLFIFL